VTFDRDPCAFGAIYRAGFAADSAPGVLLMFPREMLRRASLLCFCLRHGITSPELFSLIAFRFVFVFGRSGLKRRRERFLKPPGWSATILKGGTENFTILCCGAVFG
jgi:hypothetical protein